MIAVDQSTSSDNRKYPIKAVLPAEQTTAQAKSELEREAINPADVIKAIQSTDRTRRRGFKRKTRKKNPEELKEQYQQRLEVSERNVKQIFSKSSNKEQCRSLTKNSLRKDWYRNWLYSIT